MNAVTILYVEDSDDLRDTIGMLLEAPGREVLCCATAEEALALLAEREADIVITDVSLPGMSGTDLAHALLAANRGRWVILCSGYELGAHAHAWGARVRTLLKPFEIEALDALLNEVAESLRQPQRV